MSRPGFTSGSLVVLSAAKSLTAPTRPLLVTPAAAYPAKNAGWRRSKSIPLALVSALVFPIAPITAKSISAWSLAICNTAPANPGSKESTFLHFFSWSLPAISPVLSTLRLTALAPCLFSGFASASPTAFPKATALISCEFFFSTRQKALFSCVFAEAAEREES